VQIPKYCGFYEFQREYLAKLVELKVVKICEEQLEEMEVGTKNTVRTMCGSNTGGWSLPCVMSD
jgi:hypothetical protein